MKMQRHQDVYFEHEVAFNPTLEIVFLVAMGVLLLAYLGTLGYQLSEAERRSILANGTQNLAAFMAFSQGLVAEDAGDYSRAAAYYGQAVRSDPSRRHTIEPDLGRRIVEALQQAAGPLIAEAKPFALVVQPAIRLAIRKLVKTCLPDTPVMSFFEVPEEKAVEVVAVIGAPQALAA